MKKIQDSITDYKSMSRPVKVIPERFIRICHARSYLKISDHHEPKGKTDPTPRRSDPDAGPAEQTTRQDRLRERRRIWHRDRYCRSGKHVPKGMLAGPWGDLPVGTPWRGRHVELVSRGAPCTAAPVS